jgi:hypothetical protein
MGCQSVELRLPKKGLTLMILKRWIPAITAGVIATSLLLSIGYASTLANLASPAFKTRAEQQEDSMLRHLDSIAKASHYGTFRSPNGMVSALPGESCTFGGGSSQTLVNHDTSGLSRAITVEYVADGYRVTFSDFDPGNAFWDACTGEASREHTVQELSHTLTTGLKQYFAYILVQE